MEAFYTRISPVLVCQRVRVREKIFLKTIQKWTITLTHHSQAGMWEIWSKKFKKLTEDRKEHLQASKFGQFRSRVSEFNWHFQTYYTNRQFVVWVCVNRGKIDMFFLFCPEWLYFNNFLQFFCHIKKWYLQLSIHFQTVSVTNISQLGL